MDDLAQEEVATMNESALDRNLRLYPKLKKLTDPDLRRKSKFLSSIHSLMQIRALSYSQAVAASRIVDEQTRGKNDAAKTSTRNRFKADSVSRP